MFWRVYALLPFLSFTVYSYSEPSLFIGDSTVNQVCKLDG